MCVATVLTLSTLSACASVGDGTPAAATEQLTYVPDKGPTAPATSSVASTATTPRPTGSVSPGATTPAPAPTTTPAPQTSPAPPTLGVAPCPGTDAQAIAACLRSNVADFWSGQLNQVVDEPVVLAPVRAQVPASCRTALGVAPAFTCASNRTLYVTAPFLGEMHTRLRAGSLPFALASVQSHEIGHVVQFAVNQPYIGASNRTFAQSRSIEQQADCLSGVWARHEASLGKLDVATFYRISLQLITLISTAREIDTHGTPAQRAAAIQRGLAGGRPQSCQLATFH